MEISTRTVVNRIKNDYDDVTEYSQLVDAWNQICTQAVKSGDSELQFADVEKAAIAALSETPKEQTTGNIGQDVGRIINSFDYPTYLVTSGGYVAASNLSAWKEFSLEVRDPIDQLPFEIEGSEKISRLIEREFRRNDAYLEPALILKRTTAKNEGQEATIAISISRGKTPTALVFVITTKWRPRSARLLQQQFELTKTEAALLINFVDGYSTQDIAKMRERSHETVRAQFQSIREKLGARNQTELLRTTLSVSEFTQNIGAITNAVDHPHRRRAEQLMPGGRLVEVTMMGDFSGIPYVMIAGGSHYTFNSEFERKLYDANLLLISICPPGFGSTDRASDENKWIDQIGFDVIAVLDQLNIEKTGMLIMHTTAPTSYRVTKTHPSRFSHIVQVSTCGPVAYDQPKAGRPAWVSGILSACVNNSSIKYILLRGAVKAWATLGARQFMRLQMTTNPIDAKYALLHENIIESENALNTATRNGIADLLNEQELVVFEDWTEDIDAVRIPITVIHGVNNKLFSIESVRSLAARFPDKMKLIEIDEAGFTLAQSHPDEVINILYSEVETNQISNIGSKLNFTSNIAALA